MSIRYRKYQEKREGNKNYGKWYGRAVHLNNVSTKELAEEIAHATTATSADFGAQNVKGYKVLYQPFKRFVGNGQVTDKNRRAGSYVMYLLEGVTAKEAPKNVVVDSKDVTPAPKQ